MHAVVLSLPARRDRLSTFLHRWFTANLDGTPLTVLAASPGGPDGCLASHRAALSITNGPVLVLEDDACFTADFTLDLDPPADWDLLWLGGQHKLPPQPYDDTWCTPTYLVRTHAYIARQPRRIAELLKTVPRMDPYLAALPLHQYVLNRHTVGQTAGVSDIDGRVRTTDEFWQRHP